MNPEKEKFRFWFKILVTVAILSLCVIRFNWICIAVKELYQIVQPFLIGGLIAFVLNIPMRKIENTLFAKAKGKFAGKVKRPVSIILTLIMLVLVLSVLFLIIVPQIVETAASLPEQIKDFYYSSLAWILAMMQKYPDITETLTLEIQKIMEMEIDWQKVVSSVTDFFFNGIGGSFIKNTFSVAGKIGGGVVNGVISIIFSIYLLTQKEKLANQGKRILSAFLSEKTYGYAMRVISLLATNFSNFIAGQCIEAVILGLMIMIPMLILGFDYALLVGVLVGFTSLIPVVGAFIGCGVGAFLFLLQDPITALWFILLFLIVQQIEGNLIYPYVVGNSVGLPSLWILAAITIGGSLMGVAGMLFFIPLFSTGYILLRDSVNERNALKAWARNAWKTNYLPKSVQEMEEKKAKQGPFAALAKNKKSTVRVNNAERVAEEPVQKVQPEEKKTTTATVQTNTKRHSGSKKRKRS